MTGLVSIFSTGGLVRWVEISPGLYTGRLIDGLDGVVMR